jgi:hypothetical protein
MKKIKQSYPRNGAMLKTRFEPLSDDEFRQYVATGKAIPGQQGAALFIAKWRDGPGIPAEVFLNRLKVQGSTLEIRRYKSDVHIRVVRKVPAGVGGKRSSFA